MATGFVEGLVDRWNQLSLRQRALAVGSAAAAAALAFPPWRVVGTHMRTGTVRGDEGCGLQFLFDPPVLCGVDTVSGIRVVYVDWSQLLIELLVVGAVTAAVTFFLNE